MGSIVKLKQSSGPVLNWENAKREIATEWRLDPVKAIKDKAEQLTAYAVRIKDPELLATASAVALRAHYRIGQISKALEKAPPPGKKIVSTDGLFLGKQAKLRESNVSWALSQRAEALTEIISENEVDKICDKAVAEWVRAPSANAIYLQDQDNKKKAKFKAIENDLPSNLHVGDFRHFSPVEIKAGTIDLVFIDPPYDNESIPLYGAAAEEAKRILKPGGSLISYCGHLQLPHVLPLMSEQLDYYWIGADVHDGGPMSRMTYFGIIAGFKPLLWFVKDFRADKQTFVLDTVLTKREKGTHEWQQAVGTAEHFIKALVGPSGTVVDFFAGGGTTIVAAKNLSRKWIAFEIDEKAVPGIMERIT